MRWREDIGGSGQALAKIEVKKQSTIPGESVGLRAAFPPESGGRGSAARRF